MIAEEQLILCSRVIWRPARCLSASGTGRPWHPSDSRGLSAFGCQRKRKPRRSEAFLTGIANTGSNPCPAKFPTRLSKLGRLRRAQAHRNLPLPIYLSIFFGDPGSFDLKDLGELVAPLARTRQTENGGNSPRSGPAREGTSTLAGLQLDRLLRGRFRRRRAVRRARSAAAYRGGLTVVARRVSSITFISSCAAMWSPL